MFLQKVRREKIKTLIHFLIDPDPVLVNISIIFIKYNLIL